MTFKKRFLSALLLLALTVQLIGLMPAAAAGASESTSTPKVLIIGNSYSLDVMYYQLHNVLRTEGVMDYTMGVLYYAGCTLNRHASNSKNNTAEYTYYKIKGPANAWTKTANTAMLTALQDEDWDYIFLQQSSGYSARPASYNEDLDTLIAYVNKNKTNPNAKLGWHMTWSYQELYKDGKTYSEHFVNDFQASPLLMFNGIASTVQSQILSRPFDCVVPSGTAIQNARSSYIGDNLNRDGQHLNDMGRLIASYCWFSFLTGKPITDVKYKPSALTLSDTDKQIIIESVNNAWTTPYSVTPSAYPPTYSIVLSGGGQAEINGTQVHDAAQGTTVTLRFNPSGTQCTSFVSWEVLQGDVVLDNSASPTTSFVMPGNQVSIRANYTNDCPSSGRVDIKPSAWYHNAVDHVLKNGLMSGYDKNTFGINDPLTRAQMLQVLYNMEGQPAVSVENTFNDVAANQWYFNAVRWGSDKGLLKALINGQFFPNLNITLEQTAVTLWTYAGKPSASASLDSLSSYAPSSADALRWCVANDILKGISYKSLSDAATRAQMAQILYNYQTR